MSKHFDPTSHPFGEFAEKYAEAFADYWLDESIENMKLAYKIYHEMKDRGEPVFGCPTEGLSSKKSIIWLINKLFEEGYVITKT